MRTKTRLYSGGKAESISKVQGIESTKIANRSYYRLKCSIVAGSRQIVVDEGNAKMYSEKKVHG